MKRIKPVLRNILKFAIKGVRLAKNMTAESGVGRGLTLSFYIRILLYIVPILPLGLAIMCIMFVIFERKTQVERVNHISYLLLILLLLFLSFGILLLFDFLFTRRIDLILLSVIFSRG